MMDGRVEYLMSLNEKTKHDSGVQGGMGNGSSADSGKSSILDSSGGTNFSFINRKAEWKCRVEEDTGNSPASTEPLIGLKLGKRTYFEDVSVVPMSKKSRASYQNLQLPRCQVQGCNLDLTSAKDYHRRHRVCEGHSKSPKVIVAGVERRFCQQCSRFHDPLEFDETKRSCRRRLSDHNARRRKPQAEAIQLNSARMSSYFDARQQMSLLLNKVPLVHKNPATYATMERSYGFKPTQVKGSLAAPLEAGVTGHVLLPNNDLPNAISMLHPNSNRFSPSIGTTTAEVLHQGVEAPVSVSSLDAMPDLRRALSLLSNSSWGSGYPGAPSLDQLMHVNYTSMAQSVSPQGFPLASSGYWQAEQQQQAVSRVQLQSSGSNQFQDFNLFKVPEGFYSNEMN
ncbi:hypothetical protein GIB67_009848 [Kingdonia uniflora]|uniref:SBP-type domain-containing protein n=1 Tax=Kingdonia uniflora TaxID=39325 RepID=A0A7J7LMJ7_9MAGN|nr:hypothetical protein GIB67_009848 [Kingdonia uniflora]